MGPGVANRALDGLVWIGGVPDFRTEPCHKGYDMKNTIALVLVVLFLGLPAASLFALTDEVARIDNIDKVVDAKKPKDPTVTIIRNNKAIPDADVDFGFALQNFDQIKTGAKSMVTLQIDQKTGINAAITVKPSTVMTLDITSLKNNQSGGVNLLSGAVALKVQKMTGDNKLDVRTGTAVMGVRGTKFDVDMSESGDILLSTSEGRVECTTDNGKTLYSAPGSVVQGKANGEWSSIPVAVENLAAFRAKWYTESIAAFRADPARATAQYAKRYLDQKDKFNAAYKELFVNRDLTQKWLEEDFAGNTGDAKTVIVEKKKVLPALVKLRKINVMFERVYLRLIQLDELFAQGLNANVALPGLNMTAAAFFKQFRAERADLGQKFQEIQYMTRLYAKRNGGEFPLDQAGDPGMTSEKNVFGTDSSTDSFFN